MLHRTTKDAFNECRAVAMRALIDVRNRSITHRGTMLFLRRDASVKVRYAQETDCRYNGKSVGPDRKRKTCKHETVVALLLLFALEGMRSIQLRSRAGLSYTSVDSESAMKWARL